MEKFYKIGIALLAMGCALALGGCGGSEAAPASETAFSNTEAASQAKTALPPEAERSSSQEIASGAAPDQKGDATLYIGIPGHIKEVQAPGAATAGELIQALGKETGWNLALAQDPAAGDLDHTLKVVFSPDSAIYTAPPDPQKEDYHVYDGEDYVLTVLNSVAETLCNNLNLDGVYYTAPDGGALTLDNGGYSFCYSSIYTWDYDFAKDCNEPLPTDSIGPCFISPNQYPVIAGPSTLEIVFKRNKVRQLPGTLTVYKGDGSVFETVATDDVKKVRSQPVPDYQRNYFNLKAGEGTYFHIYLDRDLEPGETYSVEVTPGAFESEEGLKMGALPKEQWSFRCLDLKLTVTPKLNNDPVIKIGQPVTYHFQFSDDVKQVYVEDSENDGDYTCSKGELDSDGDIIFTPRKLGKISWTMEVVTKDGNKTGITENPTVVK